MVGVEELVELRDRIGDPRVDGRARLAGVRAPRTFRLDRRAVLRLGGERLDAVLVAAYSCTFQDIAGATRTKAQKNKVALK